MLVVYDDFDFVSEVAVPLPFHPEWEGVKEIPENMFFNVYILCIRFEAV